MKESVVNIKIIRTAGGRIRRRWKDDFEPSTDIKLLNP
jgi:hypothetical protein